MAEKITIVSDGTIANTKININGSDYTKDYKVTSVSFFANGGSTWKSQYSGETYVNMPAVSWHVDYLDDGKMKSMSVSTPSSKTTYGALSNKTTDALTYVGLEDTEALKVKVLDNLDNLRTKMTLPERKVLESRSVNSLIDTYIDTVNELESIAKLNSKAS